MKKFGFTLSEILLALAIIGVVSAITAPMVSGLFPDKDKVKVLKTYKLITDITNEMLEDRSLYFPSSCIGLACTEAPSNPDYSTISGNAKYAQLLAAHLELMTDAVVKTGNIVDFTTQDGVYWLVTPDTNGYSVLVDIDPSEAGSNKTYTTSDTPDRFQFAVDNNGRVTGVDELTKAYLANPYKINDKKKDYATAKSNKKSS